MSEREETYLSWITGTIQTIGAVYFVFPIIGPARVRCDFGSDLSGEAATIVGKRAQVFGRFRKRIGERWPHAVVADRFLVMPPDDELPSLMDLRGIADPLPDGVSSKEFVRNLRDEWEPSR